MPTIETNLLRCPITKQNLREISANDLPSRADVPNSFGNFTLSHGLVNDNNTYFFPIVEGIALLLPSYAFYIGNELPEQQKMPFDKKRVFEYYNEIDYIINENFSIYSDSAKWVDFRNVSSNYLKKSFIKAKDYLGRKGQYLLDVASGPIGLKEYIKLSENFSVRICVDISFKALIQAKWNLTNQEGIFICADIANLPLKENTCDAVLCQHTLYHVPKDEQGKAVEEMYRVAKPNSKIVIVYSQFYHSWLMNITLLPVQIYRIARHFAGKAFVQLRPASKPRLYFYPHSKQWFYSHFSFSQNIETYCWRSLNKYFLKIFVHKHLGGEKLLNWISQLETKHSKWIGKIGEYPMYVITKKG